MSRIPRHIERFYQWWREKERPSGSHWLAANCRYLVGAIKTTFAPTEKDATNWTYSNKTVRASVLKICLSRASGSRCRSTSTPVPLQRRAPSPACHVPPPCCVGLMTERATLVPMFLDAGLRAPASELSLLEQWQAEPQNPEVDRMLTRFGMMVERLRDVVVQSPESTFEDAAG